MPSKTKSLLQFCDRIPPALVRVMAVRCGKGRKPKLRTIDDIVSSSGLSRRMVQRLASRTTWADVKVETASKFIEGCGVDIIHKSFSYQFVRQYADNGFPQLNERERKRFFKLMGWQ